MQLDLNNGRSINAPDDTPTALLQCADQILRTMDTTCDNYRDARVTRMLVRRALELVGLDAARNA